MERVQERVFFLLVCCLCVLLLCLLLRVPGKIIRVFVLCVYVCMLLLVIVFCLICFLGEVLRS